MAMVRPGIFVATPAYGGLLYHGYFVSMMRLEKLCQARGIEVQYQVVANESLIPRARNVLCEMFLDSQLSHMIFVDADIEFDPEGILRMYHENLPVLGAVYPKKNRRTDQMSDHAVTLKEDTNIIHKGEPIAVRFIGTGMMMIRRDTLTKLIESGVPSYMANHDMLGDEPRRYHCFFDTRLYQGVYLSEDYDFCQKWTEAGGEIYAAFFVECTHWGTHGFTSELLSASYKK